MTKEVFIQKKVFLSAVYFPKIGLVSQDLLLFYRQFFIRLVESEFNRLECDMAPNSLLVMTLTWY